MSSKRKPIPDYVAAGQVLLNEIIPRAATIGAFARYKDVPVSTLRKIVAGTYNDEIGASPSILFKNCLAITNGNVEAAQFLCAEYFAALGVIPEDHNLPILMRITRVEDELRVIKHTLLKKARKNRPAPE